METSREKARGNDKIFQNVSGADRPLGRGVRLVIIPNSGEVWGGDKQRRRQVASLILGQHHGHEEEHVVSTVHCLRLFSPVRKPYTLTHPSLPLLDEPIPWPFLAHASNSTTATNRSCCALQWTRSSTLRGRRRVWSAGRGRPAIEDKLSSNGIV